jgi:hypothetical protein
MLNARLDTNDLMTISFRVGRKEEAEYGNENAMALILYMVT